MTVFRTCRFQPSALITHEVSEPTAFRVPRVLNECGKASDGRRRQMRFARPRKYACQHQGAGIVVDAIAVSAIRHRMYGVLQHTGAVAKRKEMFNLNGRNDLLFFLGGDRDNRMWYRRSRAYCF